MNRITRILIPAAVAVAAVCGYWKVDIAPKREQAAQLEQEVLTKEAALAQSQALIATYEGARAAYKDNYATVVRLGKAIPTDDDTRSLVVQLDASAARSKIDFDTINLNGAATGGATTPGGKVTPGAINAGAFSALPFSFSFTGDFNTLGNFVSRLERFVSLKGEDIAVSGRLMRIESIKLVPSATGWPGLSAQVGASAYIVPKTQAVADTAATTQAATGTTAGTSTTTASTGTDIR